MNSEGFRETLSEEQQKEPKGAKMAGKKDAKQKAGPRSQTEKSKEKTKSSAGTKNASGRSGRETAQRTQRQPPQEQASEPQECTREEGGTVYVGVLHVSSAHGVGVSHE